MDKQEVLERMKKVSGLTALRFRPAQLIECAEALDTIQDEVEKFRREAGEVLPRDEHEELHRIAREIGFKLHPERLGTLSDELKRAATRQRYLRRFISDSLEQFSEEG